MTASSDELYKQLEDLDLTEEDTEMLLADALELNKKLKAELNRIEKKSKQPNHKSDRSVRRSKVSDKSLSKNLSTGNSKVIDQRVGGTELGPKQSPLPPIHSKSDSRNSFSKKNAKQSTGASSPYAADLMRSKKGLSTTKGRVSTSAGSITGLPRSSSKSLGPVVGARREINSADSSYRASSQGKR